MIFRDRDNTLETYQTEYQELTLPLRVRECKSGGGRNKG
jgi:hypothetical protein